MGVSINYKVNSLFQENWKWIDIPVTKLIDQVYSNLVNSFHCMEY